MLRLLAIRIHFVSVFVLADLGGGFWLLFAAAFELLGSEPTAATAATAVVGRVRYSGRFPSSRYDSMIAKMFDAPLKSRSIAFPPVCGMMDDDGEMNSDDGDDRRNEKKEKALLTGWTPEEFVRDDLAGLACLGDFRLMRLFGC